MNRPASVVTTGVTAILLALGCGRQQELPTLRDNNIPDAIRESMATFLRSCYSNEQYGVTNMYRLGDTLEFDAQMKRTETESAGVFVSLTLTNGSWVVTGRGGFVE
jgi:hypothetical protein